MIGDFDNELLYSSLNVDTTLDTTSDSVSDNTADRPSDNTSDNTSDTSGIPTGDPREKMTVGEDGHFYNEDGERVFYYAPPFEAPREDTPHGWDTAGIGTDPGGYYTEAEIKDYWNNHMGTFRDQHPHMDWDTYWEYLNERQGYIESGELADPTNYRNDALNNNRNPCAGLTGRAEEVCRAQTDRDIQQEQLTSMTDWLAGDLNASLAEKYGIQSKYINSDGDEYLWNGSSYVRYYKDPGTDWGRFAASVMGAAFGAAIAPGLTGALGATGGTAAGVANGVIGSVIGQGLTTGKIDPGSVAISGLLGGLNAFIDDLIVGGELIDGAGNFTELADNTIWDLSHTLGLSYAETADIIRGVMTGVITGQDLEGIVTSAVGAWGGAKLQEWIGSTLGDSGIDIDNFFRPGDTNISTEAIAGLARDGWDALIAGGMSETDAFMALYDFFDNGGSLDFMLPGMVDFAGLATGAFGDLDICKRMPLLCDIELPECPDILKDSEGNCLGTLPDIPNPCGDGLIWDADLGQCLPDIPNPCGPGTEWDDVLQDCVPIPNPCGEGLIWDADLGKCVDIPNPCGPGTEWDEVLQDCVPIQNPCGEGLIWDADLGKCVDIPNPCGEGTEWDELLQDCVPIENPCGEGLIWDADLGECVPDIIECMDGFEWDDLLQKCVPIENPCGEGLIWDADLGKCVDIPNPCGPGTEWDSVLEDCVPIENPCGEGLIWDADLGECVDINVPKPCGPGTEWDNVLQDCVPIENPCGEGLIWDADLGECVKIDIDPPDVDPPELPDPPPVKPSVGGLFENKWSELDWSMPQVKQAQTAKLTPYTTILNSLKRDKGMFS